MEPAGYRTDSEDSLFKRVQGITTGCDLEKCKHCNRKNAVIPDICLAAEVYQVHICAYYRLKEPSTLYEFRAGWRVK